jgi:chaperonin GroES
MASFLPLGQRILVKRVEEATTTASGIIIPDNAKEKPLNAEVLAVSNEVKEDGDIQVGDNVVFAKYTGTELTVNGTEHLILNVDDILGIIG